MKKTERHQIKRDELVTAIERGTFYVENHARRLAIATVALVVLAAGLFGGWVWWSAGGDHPDVPGPGIGLPRCAPAVHAWIQDVFVHRGEGPGGGEAGG